MRSLLKLSPSSVLEPAKLMTAIRIITIDRDLKINKQNKNLLVAMIQIKIEKIRR